MAKGNGFHPKPPGLNKDQIYYAFRLLLILTGAVLLVEILGFFLFSSPLIQNDFLGKLLHSLLTVILVFPVLYFASYRPLLREINQRMQAENSLKLSQEQTEQRVVERTSELVASNQALQAQIAVRKEIEGQLEVERQRLYNVLDVLPAIVYLKAPDYTIHFANERFRAYFGDPAGKLCYRLVQEQEQPCAFCPRYAVWDEHTSVAWESTLPDGKIFQFFDYPFLDVDGQEMMQQMGIDITERKQAQIELEQRNRELQRISQSEHRQRQLSESLVQATLALNSSLEPEQVLDLVLEQIQTVIPSTASAVLLLNGDTVYLARSWGVPGISLGLQQLEAGVPLQSLPQVWRTCQQRRLLLVTDDELASERDSFLGLEWIHSAILAPLDAGEQVLGALILVSDQPSFFQPDHLELLRAFAPHAVLALQNAHLFEEIQTNRARLQALSRRLVEIQENERRLVARELHDEASQALTSIKVGLRVLARRAQEPAAVQLGVEEMNRIVDSVMDALHRLAIDLRPASLDYLGLVTALQQYTQSIAQTYSLDVQFESQGMEERLPLDMETALYRIVQEALTNVARHAQAQHADVLLQRYADKIVLVIEDDGQGFEPAAMQTNGRLGLFGMQERVEMLGGRLTVESQPGCGATIFVEVPHGA